MAKYLQWKIMCGETTCKETLCKPRPNNAEMKNKLYYINIKYIYKIYK